MLAALRWEFIKTAGLEVLFAVETCPVCGKQQAPYIQHINPDNFCQTFYCKIHTEELPESTGSKIKTSPVQCML